jgi:hypothetical protein
MDPFSYLSFLTSIVLALGVTRVLTGVGMLLQSRGRLTLYWVHLMWTLNVFLFLLLDWWILFRWSTWQNWSFFIFVFVLLTPIVAFLLTVLLFPEKVEPGLDFKTHFEMNRRSFFLLAALLPPLDFIDTALKGRQHLLDQGIIYPITIALLFVLMLVAAKTSNRRYHAFFAVFFLVYILIFITINLRLLS